MYDNNGDGNGDDDDDDDGPIMGPSAQSSLMINGHGWSMIMDDQWIINHHQFSLFRSFQKFEVRSEIISIDENKLK